VAVQYKGGSLKRNVGAVEKQSSKRGRREAAGSREREGKEKKGGDCQKEKALLGQVKA